MEQKRIEFLNPLEKLKKAPKLRNNQFDALWNNFKDKFQKKKYPKHPIGDSIFRPFKNWKQKDGRWNLWHDTFKRGILYPIVGKGLLWPIQKLIKKYFKKHDTWPTKSNIPKNHVYRHFNIMRDVYEKTFNTWLKAYYYQGYRAKNPDFKKFRKGIYNSWVQKQIRWIIDLFCLMAAEDTIYREFLAVWNFEHQKMMNKIFNPDHPQQHVFYCSYFDGDPRYFEIAKRIEKGRRMTPEYQEKTMKAQTDVNSEFFLKEEEKFYKKNKMGPTKLVTRDFKLGEEEKK